MKTFVSETYGSLMIRKEHAKERVRSGREFGSILVLASG